ncbi:MAG: hypothetical protein KAI24_12755 [Planctomycetes bacterium]|nr:hypothetical protein [Planctomycetota bacterium]
MTNERTDFERSPEDEAMQRRVDAGLCEVVGGEQAPDVRAAVLRRHRAGERAGERASERACERASERAGERTAAGLPSPRRSRVLLAAAACVLGAVTVLATALLENGDGDAREASDPEAAQDGPALPEISSMQQIQALDREVKALELRNLHDGALPLLLERVPDLEHLRVHASLAWRRHGDPEGVSITDAALPWIAKFGRLRRLELVGTMDVRGTQLHELAALPLLEELTLRAIDLEPEALLQVDRLPSLRTLRLAVVNGLTADALASIARSPGLRSLLIRGGKGFAAEDLHVLENLEQLEELQLIGIGTLHHGFATPEVMARYHKEPATPPADTFLTADCIRRWPRLERLDVSHNPQLGPALAATLRAKTPKLESLQLDNCILIDDDTIAELVRLPKLRRIVLGAGMGLTAGCVPALASASQLVEVDFGDAEWVNLAHVRRCLEAGKAVRVNRKGAPGFMAAVEALVGEYGEGKK